MDWGPQGFKIVNDDTFMVAADSEFAGWKSGYGQPCACGGGCGSCGMGAEFVDAGPVDGRWMLDAVPNDIPEPQKGAGWNVVGAVATPGFFPKICCTTCRDMSDWDPVAGKTVGGWVMMQLCGYTTDGGKTIHEDASDVYTGLGIRCNVPCPPKKLGCDPSDPMGNVKWDPKTQCCEAGEVVGKIRVTIVIRDGGVDGGGSLLGGHADVILPDLAGDGLAPDGADSLYGFFGMENPWPFPDDWSASQIGAAGFGLPGYVLSTYDEWEGQRRFGQEDRANSTMGNLGEKPYLSSICILQVCPREAIKMTLAAKKRKETPGEFNIIGRNCAGFVNDVLKAGLGEKYAQSAIASPQQLKLEVMRIGGRCLPGWTSVDKKTNRAKAEFQARRDTSINFVPTIGQGSEGGLIPWESWFQWGAFLDD